jgi:hypothetical protein
MVVPPSPMGVVYEVHGPAEPGMQLPELTAPLVLLLLLQPPRAIPAAASR